MRAGRLSRRQRRAPRRARRSSSRRATARSSASSRSATSTLRWYDCVIAARACSWRGQFRAWKSGSRSASGFARSSAMRTMVIAALISFGSCSSSSSASASRCAAFFSTSFADVVEDGAVLRLAVRVGVDERAELLLHALLVLREAALHEALELALRVREVVAEAPHVRRRRGSAPPCRPSSPRRGARGSPRTSSAGAGSPT